MNLLTEKVGKYMTNVLKQIKTKIIIQELLKNNNNNKIILLRNDNVLNWIFGNLNFLKENTLKCNYKYKEDEWGRYVLKTKRPDLKLDKQWTNKFGEHIIEELYMLLNISINKAKKINKLLPDFETEEFMIEIKTQTFFTSGTASEKIIGSPFKYADVPLLYNKPLKIICIGGAEKALTEFDIINCSSETKKKFLQIYRENGIEFMSFRNLISNLIK